MVPSLRPGSILLLMLLNSCAQPGNHPAARPQSSIAASDSIGVATQEPDGTIVLVLRAEGQGEAVGEGLLRYPRSDPDYDMISKHVGPIPPGGTVMVKPFPE